MAGRGRGSRAAFPEVRHQLRRPKDDSPQIESAPAGDSSEKEPQVSSLTENDDIKKLCGQFKYLEASDTDFQKHLSSLKQKLETKEDLEHAARYIYELGQLGPDQAEVASRVAVRLADVALDGVKLRRHLLLRMQTDFEALKERSQSSPDSVLFSAIFLCEFYSGYHIMGTEPLNSLRVPVWEYLKFMLLSRKPYYVKHCLRLMNSKGAFFVKHCSKELEAFLVHIREFVLDEEIDRTSRSSALETLEHICRELLPLRKNCIG